MRRVRVSFIALILLVVVALTGWSSGQAAEGGTDEPQEVLLWTFYAGSMAPVMEKVVEGFEESHPNIGIEYVTMSQGDVNLKIAIAVASGDAPDVFVRKGLQTYASQNILLPLDEYFAAENIDEDTFFPGMWDLLTWEGVPYGVPSQADAPVMYYHPEMFESAGVTSIPTTWEELEAANEAITQTSGGKVDVMGHFLRQSFWTDVYSYYFGANVYDPESKQWTLDPKVIEYYEWVESYVAKYGGDRLEDFGAALGDWNTPAYGFWAEKTAVVLQGEWFHYFTEQNNQSTDYETALWPSTEDAITAYGGPRVYQEADIIMITRTTEVPDAAFEFLWYWGGPNGQADFHLDADGSGRATALSDYASMDFVARSPNPFIEAHLELLEQPAERKFWRPLSPVSGVFGNEMGVLLDVIFEQTGTARDMLPGIFERVQEAEDKFWDEL